MRYSASVKQDRIDEAVLALLYLGIHERDPAMGAHTWMPFDWGAMNRLHEKGLISNPVNKAKSVTLTEAGLRRAEEVFLRLFEKDNSLLLTIEEHRGAHFRHSIDDPHPKLELAERGAWTRR